MGNFLSDFAKLWRNSTLFNRIMITRYELSEISILPYYYKNPKIDMIIYDPLSLFLQKRKSEKLLIIRSCNKNFDLNVDK